MPCRLGDRSSIPACPGTQGRRAGTAKLPRGAAVRGRKDRLATFVLCHDAWEGGWVWQETALALAALGHDAYRPTYTGLGERRHLAHAGVDLTTHREDVGQLLTYEELHGVVLVGHGYGAAVATGVADDLPERVRLLVLLDPYLPARGQSFLDLFGGTPIREQLVGQAQAYGDGWRITPPFAPADVRVTAQPLATFSEPLALRHPPRVPRQAIACAGRAATPLFQPVAASLAALAAAGVTVHEIACGHRAPTELPLELAALLDRIVLRQAGSADVEETRREDEL